MKSSRIFSLLVLSMPLLILGAAHAADKVAMKPAAASAVVAVQASGLTKAGVAAMPSKSVATTGAATIGKAGDSSIPSGSIPIPPKPKKEGLEAGAIKANKAVQH